MVFWKKNNKFHWNFVEQIDADIKANIECVEIIQIYNDYYIISVEGWIFHKEHALYIHPGSPHLSSSYGIERLDVYGVHRFPTSLLSGFHVLFYSPRNNLRHEMSINMEDKKQKRNYTIKLKLGRDFFSKKLSYLMLSYLNNYLHFIRKIKLHIRPCKGAGDWYELNRNLTFQDSLRIVFVFGKKLSDLEQTLIIRCMKSFMIAGHATGSLSLQKNNSLSEEDFSNFIPDGKWLGITTIKTDRQRDDLHSIFFHKINHLGANLVILCGSQYLNDLMGKLNDNAIPVINLNLDNCEKSLTCPDAFHTFCNYKNQCFIHY